MNKLRKTLKLTLLSSFLPCLIGAFSAQVYAENLIIGNGNNALTTEKARQSKEQWNDSQLLRKKVNQRTEKEFTKIDNAIDVHENCMKSSNVNIYWEPNTLRCLDRRTGRQITP